MLVKLVGVKGLRRSTFSLALRLAGLAVAIRMIFAVLIGVPMPGTVVFAIPQLQLPNFLVGIRIGGDVTTQRLSTAFEEATLFAGLIIAFGAANALTTATKILKVIPRNLYGVGIAAALATTLTPQLAHSIARVRQAQFLRGQAESGIRSWKRTATPVFEDSISRSLDLAAALEARGYGVNERPTRYRPIKWDAIHSLALFAALYLALVLPILVLPTTTSIAIFAAILLTPVAVFR